MCVSSYIFECRRWNLIFLPTEKMKTEFSIIKEKLARTINLYTAIIIVIARAFIASNEIKTNKQANKQSKLHAHCTQVFNLHKCVAAAAAAQCNISLQIWCI